ncbi:MAG: hypothetical protein ACI9WU_003227, partial [Myxococcota bacterium]
MSSNSVARGGRWAAVSFVTASLVALSLGSISLTASSANAQQCGGACANLPAGLFERHIVTNAANDPQVSPPAWDACLVLDDFFGPGQSATFRCDPGSFLDVLDGPQAQPDAATLTLHLTLTTGPATRIGEQWTGAFAYTFRGVGPAGQGTGGPKLELPAGTQPAAITDAWRYFDPGQAVLQ